jgi:lysophospholipase-3
MYTENNNKRIVMVCHSYGCTYNYHFLLKASPGWKGKYIKSWVTLGAPFAGSTQALQAILSGYNLNIQIGFLTSALARDLAKTFSSVSAALPVDSVYGDQAILMLEGLKFTAEDMPVIFRMLNDSVAFQMWQRARRSMNDSFPHPGVEVHCLRARGTPTIETLVYNSMNDFPDSPILVNGPGDGSVNSRSANICLRWSKEKNFFTQEFDANVDHMSLVQGKQAADYIIKSVLRL